MKKLLLIAATLLHGSHAVAADYDSPSNVAVGDTTYARPEADRSSNLFGKNDGVARKHSWWLAPTLGMTRMGSDTVFEGGLRGAFRINRQYGIGFAGQGWEMPAVGGRTMEGGFGGPMFEAVFWKDSVVHLTTQTVVGGGWYCASGPAGVDACRDAYGFFGVDGSVNLELNVSKNVHLLVGFGNRFVLAEDGPISNGDLSGFVGRTSIALGQF